MDQTADIDVGSTDDWTDDPALELAIQGERLCSEGNLEEGIKCLEGALEAGPKDSVALSALYSQLGSAYFFIKSFDQAVAMYGRELELAKREGDRCSEARAAANISNTLKAMGRFDDALKMSELHLKVCRELGDKEGEVRAVNAIGTIYHTISKHLNTASPDGTVQEESKEALEKAVSYYKENLELVLKLGNLKAEGKIYGNLGNIYYLLGNFQLSIHYHKLRLKNAQTMGDLPSIRRTYINLANAFLFIGQPREAVECYLNTIELAKSANDKALEAQMCYSIANTYSFLLEYRKAVQYLLKHLHFAEELGDTAGEAKACWCLGSMYTELQEHDKAYLFTCRHLDLSVQLNDREEIAIAQKNLDDLSAILEVRDLAKKSSEKSRFLTSLFHKSRVKSTQPISSQLMLKRSSGRWSFSEASTSKVPTTKLKRSTSGGNVIMDSQKDCSSPEMAITGHTRSHSCLDDVQFQKMNKGIEEPEKCSPVREDNTPSARPKSPEEGKDLVDDGLLDMIFECQGRRMDDQRSSVGPGSVHLASRAESGAVQEETSPKTDTPEPQLLARRNPLPVIDVERRRISDSLESLDDRFLDRLMTAQNSRLEDQRSPDPFLELSKTLPGEDFLNLLLQLQSMRMEDQRSPFPNSYI